jgi:hypothetical protein
MDNITVLKPVHTSFESAHVIESYPYGGYRTQMKIWIETKKNQQRVCTCTKNPKNGKWNKPHASTYSEMRILFIDNTTGHVENDGINQYNILEKSNDFLVKYGEGLTEDQKNNLVYFAAHVTQEKYGIKLYTDGAAKFYSKLSEVLTEMGREDLIKFKTKK